MPDTTANESYIQSEKARIAAIKKTLGDITAGTEAEATAAAGGVAAQKQAAELRGANAAQQAAYQGGLQLAQQTSQGMGYNKAAARQTALDVGATGGAAIGEAKAQGILGAQEAGEKAAKARTEAVSQKLEQLKTEQEVSAKSRDLNKNILNDLAAKEAEDVNSTKSNSGDDEEKAVQNLMNTYNENSDDYDNSPGARKALGDKVAGIIKDAITSAKMSEIPQAYQDFFAKIGYSWEDYNKAQPWDY